MDFTNIEKVLTISAEDKIVEENGELIYKYAHDTLNEYLSKGWILLGLDYQTLGVPNGASLYRYILGMPKSDSSK